MPIYALLAAAALPVGNPGNWITPDDYPNQALRDGVEGKSTVTLTISPEGKPVGCEISISSGSADLDTTTCELLTERGRFEMSPSGTTQSFSTAVEWRIPPAPLMPISAIGFTALTDLSKGQVVGDCESSTIGEPDEQLDICELLAMPGATDKVGLDTEIDATKLQMRLIIAPKGNMLPTAFAFTQSAKTTVLFKAQFDVDANGVPGNCAVFQNVMGAEIEGFCDAVVSVEPQFDVANAKEFPVTMELTIDATAGTPQ